MKTLGIFILLFGLFSSKKGVEATNKDDLESAFIVARPDTEQVTCVSKDGYQGKSLRPSYDLDKLQIPSGGLTWKWPDDWQMTNIEVPNLSTFIFTDSGSKFQKFNLIYNEIEMLASNASLWFFPEYLNKDEGRSLLIQIDHLNESTGLKYTRVMSCNEMPKDKKEEDKNCKTLNITHGTNLLSDGRNWAIFYINSIEIENKKKSDASSMCEWSFKMRGYDNTILFELTWMWPTLQDQERYYHDAFVRTHQKPGVFNELFGWDIKPEQADNQMSKNFSHPRAGPFCVQIYKFYFGELRLHCDLLNLGNNQMARQELFSTNEAQRWIKIEFGHLEAGKYQVTLRNISMRFVHADLCPGRRIGKTPMPTFPAPNHCRLVTFYKTHRSIYSEGYTNSTLKTQWDADEWAYVCDQLGVSDNQTERVPIKFCNPFYGCNFSKCPHRLEDDQIPLFAQFLISENNSTLGSENFCFGDEI